MQELSKQQTGYEYLDNAHMVQNATGEIVGASWGQYPCGTIHYTPEQQEAYKRRKEFELQQELYKANTDPFGRFCFMDAGKEYKDLPPHTVARLVFLATYLPHNSNRLQRTKDKPLKKNDIEKLLGISRASFFRFWQETNGSYLTEDESGNVCFISSFMRGKLPQSSEYTSYQKLYINRVRELYRKTPVTKHCYLGYVFQMLPYVSREYNVLCFNPEEEDLDYVEAMTVNDFCKGVGVDVYHRARLVKAYANIKLPVPGGMERFCSFVSDGTGLDDAKIFVNPKVMYSGHCWERVEILGTFSRE